MMNNLVLALANDAEYATVKKLLKKELTKWMADQKDPGAPSINNNSIL
jgi:hypothetical protein